MADQAPKSGIRGLFNNIKAHMNIDQMFSDLSLFKVADKKDETLALATVDKIGTTLTETILGVSEKNYYDLEGIWRNGQTEAVRQRALEWIFEIGINHPEVSTLIVNQTKDLLNSETSEEKTRLLATKGIGMIGQRFPRRYGNDVLLLILDQWQDSSEAARKEKFQRAQSILSALSWRDIKNQREVLVTLDKFRKAGDKDKAGSEYATQLLSIVHKKQREGLNNNLD